jgi:hypothetical protein
MEMYGQLHGLSLLQCRLQDKHHFHPTSSHGHHIDITNTEIKNYKNGVVCSEMMSFASNIIISHVYGVTVHLSVLIT